MMNERIKYLRRNLLKLTQAEFGSKLGMKGNSISDLETGKNGISESLIKLICSQFNVNEEWLRYGNGIAIKEKNTSSLLEELKEYYKLDEYTFHIIKQFLELPNEQQTMIANFVRSLVPENKKTEIEQNIEKIPFLKSP